MHQPVSPMAHVMPTYGRMSVAMSHGRGLRLWDTEGREYLDALSGIAVNTLGHGHPRLVAALQDQVAKIIHSCNYYQVPLQEQLAAKLVSISGLTNVFFCNSGLEANEGALKIARKYGHDTLGFDNPQTLVFEGAFHGRSLATLSATANPKVQAGFGPLVPGFIRAPFNKLAAVETLLDANPQTSAIFLECIQGEGGINPARVDFLQGLRRVCDERKLLLMLDEVQCGIGRTGKWFAHQWADIHPDVMPLAKGLGSGVPVGAIVCGPRAAGVLTVGNHGTTFGGNPLAMRAGVETLAVMESDGLVAQAGRNGERLRNHLTEGLGSEPGFVEIRGQGLMLGIELDRPCGVLMQRALDAGLLISVTADRVVRLLPALIASEAEVDEIAARLLPLIKTFLADPKP
jgi:acetylornithine/N-succinyldiaminopimelate aminotransferase